MLCAVSEGSVMRELQATWLGYIFTTSVSFCATVAHVVAQYTGFIAERNKEKGELPATASRG